MVEYFFFVEPGDEINKMKKDSGESAMMVRGEVRE